MRRKTDGEKIEIIHIPIHICIYKSKYNDRQKDSWIGI